MEDLNLPDKIIRGSHIIPSLNGSNYSVWKKYMRVLLMGVGVLDIINSDRPNDADAKWLKCDR